MDHEKSEQDKASPAVSALSSWHNRFDPYYYEQLLAPKLNISEKSILDKNTPKYNPRFRWDYGTANLPHFPHIRFTNCEPENYEAGANPLDRGDDSYMYESQFLEKKTQIITSKDKFSMCKANVCIRGGEWYFEIGIKKTNVKCGIGRREALCNAAAGSNSYSYAIHDRLGEMVHCAVPRKFCDPLKPGDVLGFHIKMPIDSKPSNVIRTRTPAIYNDQVFLESVDYADNYDIAAHASKGTYLDPPKEELIAGSFCRVFVNGDYKGALAEPLRDFRVPHCDLCFDLSSHDDGLIGYFPIISTYDEGAAEFILGPDFRYSKPTTARPLNERFYEQIADDVTSDILNDVLYGRMDRLCPEEYLNETSSKRLVAINTSN